MEQLHRAHIVSQKIITDLYNELQDPKAVIFELANIATTINCNLIGNIFINKHEKTKEVFDFVLEEFLADQAKLITMSVWQNQNVVVQDITGKK